jgi:dTMP kinase
MSKKPIIVFEGIEGSGKTFHINNVQKHLIKKKIKFISIREPGGSINAEKIRKLILNNKSNFDKVTDLLLYLAARNENINILIRKNINKKIILIDRFIDSTIAYQHYGMGVDLSFINYINNFLLKNIKPDFTFLNLVNKKNLKLRLSKRKNLNRYDKFELKFYNKVQLGFIKLSNFKKNKYLKINSNSDVSINKKIILNKIDKLI